MGIAYSHTSPFRADPESRIIHNLDYIENMYFKYLSPHERREAVKIMNETRELIVGVIGGPSHYHNIMGDEAFLFSITMLKRDNGFGQDKTNPEIPGQRENNLFAPEKLVALYTFDNRRKS